MEPRLSRTIFVLATISAMSCAGSGETANCQKPNDIDWINSDRTTFEKHLKALKPKPGWIGHVENKVTLTPRAPRDKVTDVELFEVHENGTVTLRHHSILHTVKVGDAIPDDRHPDSIFLDSADYDKQTAIILYFTAIYREGQ